MHRASWRSWSLAGALWAWGAVAWAQAPATASDPAGHIAYVDPDGRLALLDPTTGDAVAVTAAGARTSFPVWSSGGDRVAVIALDQMGPHVDVVDVARGATVATVHRLTGRTPIYLDWSPDDRWLAVLAGLSSGRLALDLVDMTVPGGALRPFAEGAPFFWDWSPTDPALLVHVDVGGPAARAGVTPLAAFFLRQPLPEPAGFQSPAFSSDGRLVAYARLDPSGRSVVALPSPERPDVTQPPRLVPVAGVVALAWRPGAPQLAIQRAADRTAVPVGPVDVLDVATGDVHRLSDDRVVASFWSPDGRFLATLSLVGGGGEREALAATPADPVRVATERPAQFAPLTLALKVIDVDAGGARPLGVFTPSPLFATQYLPFFDQYARSHRLWSPSSDALVLPALDDAGVPTLVRFGVDGDVRPLVAGDLPAWNVR